MCLKKKLQLWAVPAISGTGYPALVPTDTMLFFDVIDVGCDVILGELLRIEMVVISKNIAYFGHIVADGHGRIGFGFKERS